MSGIRRRIAQETIIKIPEMLEETVKLQKSNKIEKVRQDSEEKSFRR